MKTFSKKCAAGIACILFSFNVTAGVYSNTCVEALPVTSITSYVYDNSAAGINITSKPDDTVFTSDISISGSVNTTGKIRLEINGKQVGENISISQPNGAFAFKGALVPGRNDVNLYFTNGSGKTTRKTFNFVYLQKYDFVVDKSFSGQNGSKTDGHAVYNSINAAIQAAAPGTVIFVKNGGYNERVTVTKENISLIGQDSQKTKVFYSLASKDSSGMTERNCMKIAASASGFTMENMTVENSYPYKNGSGEQADAICVLADRSIFANVRFVSYQDTVLTDSSSSSVIARQFFYKCYITGNVDFIYGRGRSYFEDCDIVGRYTTYKKDGCYTAPRTEAGSTFGYVFNNCRFTAENGIGDGSYRLGRPWGASAALAFVNCYMGPCILNTAYGDMSGNLYKNARFSEYKSFGRGAAINGDRPQIQEWQIQKYKAANVFADGTTVKFDYESKMDKMYIDPNAPAITTPPGQTTTSPGQSEPPASTPETITAHHNFTDNGSQSSFFKIAGSIQNDKGTVTYSGMSMDYCLKLDSKGSISFETKNPNAELTIATRAKIDDASILLNGASNSGLSGLAMSGNVKTITLGQAGTYTLSKGAGETYVYYISVADKASDSTPKETSSTTSIVTTAETTTAASTAEITTILTTVTQMPETTTEESATAPIQTTTPVANEIIYGDMNGDGIPDLTDLTLLSLYLLHDVTFTPEQQKAADINGNGEINLGDLAHFKQYVMSENVRLGPAAK